jgi:hypothetical protein
MKRLLLTCLLALPVQAYADDGNTLGPACKRFLDGLKEREYGIGVCVGTVATLATSGSNYSPDWRICAPPDVTTEQAVKVVVKFLDDNTPRLHEDFQLLAHEALQKAWPCQGGFPDTPPWKGTGGNASSGTGGNQGTK